MPVLLQIDAYDPATAQPVTLRACSHDDPAVCHAQGQTWWPTISKLPVLRYDLFDGAFDARQITSPSSSLTVQVEPWPKFGRYAFADARLRLWTGSGADWTLRFDGRVSNQPTIENGAAQIDFAVDDRWLDKALLSLYAGTTGAEGPVAMKGQAKPLALGAPRYVPGKLIDSVNSVFQISAYGAIVAIEAALDKLVRFGAPMGDFPTYAALVAANIPAGRWATALAVGMARLGAPPNGQVSFLVQGDSAGPNGWARKPGQIIRRLALLSGGASKILDASLDALDAARPFNLSVYVDEQTTARQLIQDIATSVNAVAGVTWTGQLFVVPVQASAPIATLAADGSALPPVSSVRQIDVAVPYSKLAIGAARAWVVHALSDIAFTAPLIPMGDYADGTTYREGNIVQYQGSSWLYIATTPGSGHTPPFPAASDAWWQGFAMAGQNGTNAPLLRTQWSVDGVSGWHDNYFGADQYQRQSNDNGVTYGPAIRAIGEDGATGVDGVSASQVFIRSATVPPRPGDNTGNPPSGWYDGPPAGADFIWQSSAKFRDSTQLTSWTDPQRISGDPGSPGEDGTPGVSPSVITINKASLTFAADSTGTVKPGQQPQYVQANYKTGDVDHTTSAIWTIPSASTSASISVDSTGKVTITSVTGAGQATVRGSYAGVTPQDQTFNWTRPTDPPPPAGATSLSGSPSGTVSASTTTYPASPRIALTVQSDGSGQLRADLTLSFYADPSSGGTTTFHSFNIDAYVGYRVAGSGGAFTGYSAGPISGSASTSAGTDIEPESEGTLSLSQTQAGLTANTQYEMGFFLRRSSSVRSSLATFTSGFTVRQP